MKENMLGKLVLALPSVPTKMFGTLLDLVNKLGGEKGQEIFVLLKYLLRGEVLIIRPKVIDWIGTIKTSVTTENFVAKDKFTKHSVEVKFYGPSDNFTRWFLKDNGKIEKPISEQELRYGNHAKNSPAGSIIEELGGEVRAETTLTELYDLLKKQSNGEEGILLTSGYVNIFYIRDTSGSLRAVNVYWRAYRWNVYADVVGSPCDWSAYTRIFSRIPNP